jgi:opacity protein-like surface antigen
VRRLALAALLAIAVAPAGIAAAAASPSDTQCASGNHWCTAILRHHGKVALAFAGFGLTGTYDLCVTPPKAKETCHTFGLQPNATGASSSAVQFAKHFPHAHKGRYHVRWIYADKQVGKSMAFTP